MPLGPNPVLASERRTASFGAAELTGLDSVDWLVLYVTNSGDAEDDAVINITLEGSVDGNSWAGFTGFTVYPGNTMEYPRSVIGQPFAIHDLPPYARVAWEAYQSTSGESEFGIQASGGRS